MPINRATTPMATVTQRRRDPCMYTAMVLKSSDEQFSCAGHDYRLSGIVARRGGVVADSFARGNRRQPDNSRCTDQPNGGLALGAEVRAGVLGDERLQRRDLHVGSG